MNDDSTEARRSARPKAPRKAGRCPVCGAPIRRRFRPFCSRRCADADLGRWLRGAYRIPTDEAQHEGIADERPPDDDAVSGGGR